MLRPLRYDRAAPLARAHPLAKLGAALIVMLGAFVALDPVTPAILLAAVLATVPALGLAPRSLARRVAPLAIAAVGAGVFNGWFAQDALAGVAVGLRIAAVALAGVVALATVEPTELADALIQHLRVSPRFAVGALAALRLAPLFAREWELIGLARRARGVAADRAGIAALLAFPDRTHALLVAAVRRATDLALAMDARGFGTRDCRTVARPRSFGARDVALLLGAVSAVAVAIALSVASGAWRALVR